MEQQPHPPQMQMIENWSVVEGTIINYKQSSSINDHGIISIGNLKISKFNDFPELLSAKNLKEINVLVNNSQLKQKIVSNKKIKLRVRIAPNTIFGDCSTIEIK